MTVGLLPPQVRAVLDAAVAAAPLVARATPTTRGRWLGSLAQALLDREDELVALAGEETGLGTDRLHGELRRTAENARYYAAVAQQGDCFRSVLDRSVQPELRRARLPRGPVAVFAASNFPFQFGTLGHDTASALAAGSPVVVKSHPAHPRTAALLARSATETLAAAGAPSGTFGAVTGFEQGLALVDSPAITAVGFTGSQTGGLALVERAGLRDRPIPVFAEMGTVNPVILTEGAVPLLERVVPVLIDALLQGDGQFCTKPGLFLVPRGSGASAVFAAQLRPRSAGRLLTPGMTAAFDTGVAGLITAGATVIAAGRATTSVRPHLLQVPAELLGRGTGLDEEVFGPVGLVVEYSGAAEALSILDRLQPALAASVFGSGDDDPALPELITALAGRVGRVVVDGVTTGVACSDAMHHGGPWPATSRPDHTSVGAAALDRWLQPVAFQGVPDPLLPPALQSANPWGIVRREKSAR